MKKILPILIITLSMSVGFTPTKALGDIVECVNCSEVGTQNTSWFEQKLQSIQDKMNMGANVEKNVKSSITDPIMNALLSSAIDTTKQSLNNWIQGGFQGNPLVAIKPETYLNNVGKNVIRIKIGEISNSTDKNKGTVIKNIVYSERAKQKSITERTQSTLASDIRQDTCTDSNLSNYATKSITSLADTNSLFYKNCINNGGSADTCDQGRANLNAESDATLSSRIAARKKQLYDSLCPPDKEQALLDCYYNDRSGLCFSMTAWVDTNPNNTVDGHTAEVARLTDEAAAAKVALAANDTKDGYISQKDSNGNIITPAAIVAETDKIISTESSKSAFYKSGSDLTTSLINKLIKGGLSFLSKQTKGTLAQSGINSTVLDNFGDFGNLNGIDLNKILLSGQTQSTVKAIYPAGSCGADDQCYSGCIQSGQIIYPDGVCDTVTSSGGYSCKSQDCITKCSGMMQLVNNICSIKPASTTGNDSGSNMLADMTNDEHDALISPMLNRLTLDIKTFSAIVNAYGTYTSDVGNYVNQIQNAALVGCYTQIQNGADTYKNQVDQYKKKQVTDHYNSLLSTYQGNISGWKSNLDNRLNYLKNIKAGIDDTINQSNNGISRANSTIQKLITSRNKEEINTTYFSYNDTTGNSPTAGSEGLVEPKKLELQYNVSTYNTDTLAPMTNSCNQIKNTIDQDMASFIQH